MSQVRCPYCGSIQVKAMSNQPKKYPRPSDPIALQDWQKGYDCKKCGNDFIVAPPKPKKQMGIFTKLLCWLFVAVIAFIVYAAITNSDTNDNDTVNKSKPVQEINNTKQAESSLNQVFSEEAEKAAHEYIPPLNEKPHKRIANSKDQNDTLSIKTTLREKE